MKIRPLIEKVREEKPNSFTDAKLVNFINSIEAEVATNLNKPIPTYSVPETGSDGNELLAPPPYDSLYVSYVKAQIDFANEEYASYQNNQVQHVLDWDTFNDWVVRERKEVVAPGEEKITNFFNIYT